ncbi:hypothetical protein RO3G_08716 [Rhizopus delemar RA 99-880]|uniref:Uncharacterized protein n=1 Tax=Rhizopus delemar (strain RA 99-880 / ATCC MYA-4621 / FGSC 9543 / NRRL 43880) TaxID=246409 RepID=I1C6D1_RHIO9|nr:hypothetical protein RO3G_08716 [Rhizopus delemar RA 99-880]|eukprot:EIE84011.1 hypothetical protein RO3G_08716 [Rhizopus delemar RA 99-880]
MSILRILFAIWYPSSNLNSKYDYHHERTSNHFQTYKEKTTPSVDSNEAQKIIKKIDNF